MVRKEGETFQHEHSCFISGLSSKPLTFVIRLKGFFSPWTEGSPFKALTLPTVMTLKSLLENMSNRSTVWYCIMPFKQIIHQRLTIGEVCILHSTTLNNEQSYVKD